MAFAAAATLAVGATVSLGGTARRTASPSGHVVFTRAGGRYGDETIFVAKADFTSQRRISSIGRNCCPYATPTGSRIAFAGSAPDGRVTAVMTNLEGRQRVVLPLPKGTLNLAAGPISRDGSRIVREGWDDRHPSASGVYVTRASDGRILRRLTRTQFIPGDLSPNGTQVVLFKNVEGEPPPPGGLWVVKMNGSGLRRLTPARVRVACCNNYHWSPDGTKILFADAEGVLWTIAPDGSRLTRIFKDAEGRYAITPTWSPDGSMIMFALDPVPDSFQHPANGLFVIAADGSGLTQVLGGSDFKREPNWVSG